MITAADSAAGRWAQDALAKTFAVNGKPANVVRIRMLGGSVPTDLLDDALHTAFIQLPLVNDDNNQHSFDENLRIGNFFDGARSFIGLLQTPL